MIKIFVYAGEKISPIEVDAVLLSHPDIAQAVAFGVPDDKYGEEVMNPFSHIFWLFPFIMRALQYICHLFIGSYI